MIRTIPAVLLFSAMLFVASPAAATVSIDTVHIGNPGNANDPVTGDIYGGVAYQYDIGKYDVTVGQYTEFLNAVAATDTYSLYSASMATDLNVAGISRSGVAGSYSYSVIDSANKPVTYVSWGDAVRFANWLQNGQPMGLQGPGTTETGAYTLNGAMTTAELNAVTRNVDATWFLPSASEWYKSAYYDPRSTAAGGPPADSHYWNYATGTNVQPTSAPPGSTPNTANYFGEGGGFGLGYAVTGSTVNNPSQNYLTDVGAYTASASPSGTFDQVGNVFQWNEGIDRTFRSLRGGFWSGHPIDLPRTSPDSRLPNQEFSIVGFRVASYPAPSLPGDVNLDGVVNAADIAIVGGNWLHVGFAGAGDANHDGTVNAVDIALVGGNWLHTTPAVGTATAVPEPGPLALAGLGGLALLAARRRR